MTKKIYCVIGLPLSGKSYFAKMLAKTNKYGYISTGDIARELMAEDPDAAAKTKDADMYPNEDRLRANLVVGIHTSLSNTVLVDGFPRSGDQIDYMLKNMWHWFPEIIDVNAGDESTLIRRARERARDDSDSDLHAFTKRLTTAKKNQVQVYRTLTARSLQWKTVLSGDDASMLTQFKKATGNE